VAQPGPRDPSVPGREVSMNRWTHRPSRLAVTLLVATGLTGCALVGGDDATPGLSPGATPAPTETGTQTDEPSTPSSPTPTTTDPEVQDGDEEPETPGTAAPGSADLSGSGVADVPFGAADPLPRLTELFGPPDETLTAEDYGPCGSGDNTGAVWGDLTVELAGGALWGWNVTGTSVPADANLPEDVAVGDPLSQVLEVTSATPEYLEPYGVWITDAGDVTWWTDSDEPDAPVTMVVGGNLATCG
jgi:hypothetical protein